MEKEENLLARENAQLRERISELEKKVKIFQREREHYVLILRSQKKLIQSKDEFIKNHEFGRMRFYLELFEATDTYTEGHSLRVTKYSIMIAKAMGLPEDLIDLLHRATHMHDIGKLHWDEEDFQKKNLTEDERKRFREHPIIGAKRLEELAKNHKEYEGLAPIVRHHHEYYDSISIITHPDRKYIGYPGELSGENIPLLSRIIAVGDSFDAMTTDRAYKKKMSIKAALEELKRCSGMPYDEELIPNKKPEMQFDPKIVKAFFSIETVGSSKSKIAHKIGCIDLFEIDSVDMVVNSTGYALCECVSRPPKYVMYKPAV